MMCPFNNVACSNNCALFIADKIPYMPNQGIVGKCAIAVIAESVQEKTQNNSKE